MNVYFVELIVFLLVALFVTVIFKVKKKHKLKLILFTLLIIFSVSIAGTYLLEKPHVHISQEISLQINQYSEIKAPYTTYHMKDVTSSVKVNGTVDYNKVGTYKIEYEVPTIVGEYSVEQTINVVDSIKPTITLNGDKVYNLSYSAEYVEPGYTVEDNSSEDLTEKVNISKEEISDTEYDIIYSVEDSSGNMAVERRKVLIVDDIAPVITLNGSANMRILVNSTYKEKGATAVDEKDGDLSDKIEISGEVNTSKAGEYNIKYTVSDKSGNKAEKTRKVIVYKESANSSSSSGTGVIYLTFDDGPSSSITPKILDILKEKNVKATFFVLNYSSSLEYLIKREYNEGHSIGIHGYSHVYSEIYTSDEAFMNNVTKLQKKIAETIGYSPTIIRFPGGSSNTVSMNYNKGIMSRLSKTVIDAGFRYYDWNVSAEDAAGAQTSTEVYNNVVNNLSKSRSNVVLMHDSEGNTKTLNALSDIIDYGLENGYTFKTITKDTPMITHRIYN